MATESVTREIVTDLAIIMEKLESARTMAWLAEKADKLDRDEARVVFRQLRGYLDLAHNDVDVARERLEA